MVILFRALLPADPELFEESFAQQGWHKPAGQYKAYLKEQSEKTRDVIVAMAEGAFAGYVTVIYASAYAPFREQGIPEISDLNVLKKYQGLGIGSALITEAEKLIAQRASCSGLGVGLLRDYGPAQKLYVGLGYRPDGLGITYQYKPIEHGTTVPVDDDLVLWLVKRLKS